MKIKSFDLWLDNEKHLFFVNDDLLERFKPEELADIVYKNTGRLLDISVLTTHEFPNTDALINFLNGKTLHLSYDKKDDLNKELGIDIWL